MPKAQINLKPELKIIKEEEIPHLLVPGEMGAVLELTVKDKRGEITDHRVMRSKSFTRQFLELLWIEFNKISKYSPLIMQDTGGDYTLVYEYKINFDASAAAGDVTHGIIVGTGDTAPTINDYALQTPIAHGSGAAELEYSAVTIAAPASGTNVSQFTITRDFSNAAAGGAITVNEIGLYVKGYDIEDNTYYFMIIRDKIDGGIAVPDGQTLTVNYREQAAI